MAGRPSISTHVLDTERGEPAQAVPITLLRRDGDTFTPLTTARTDRDGRIADLANGALAVATYRILFDVAAYFQSQGGDAPFFTTIQIDFEIADLDRHYHVPLLLARYSCTSYRGSR